MNFVLQKVSSKALVVLSRQKCRIVRPKGLFFFFRCNSDQQIQILTSIFWIYNLIDYEIGNIRTCPEVVKLAQRKVQTVDGVK